MKTKAIAAAILMASGISSAQADETLSVDKFLGVANSIHGQWEPLPGPVGNDKPNVDVSLGLLARNILN